MKYCPICDARYDEEVIKFCTRDGTPLIEEAPSFTERPSESDDIGEETVIRRRDEVPTPFDPVPAAERIIIPTEPAVRARTVPVYHPPPEPPNTVRTVVLTILGTIGVLACGALLFWVLQKDQSSNIDLNVNTNPPNQNLNLNANTAFDSNFNFNTNTNINASPANYNFNFNTAFNTATRTPSPTPTPRQTASPTPSPTAAATVSPTARPVLSPRPANTNSAASGTPRIGPRPPTPSTPSTNRPE